MFTSIIWKQPTDIQGIHLRLLGTRAHSSLEIGERYDEPPRRIFQNIQFSHPRVPQAYTLRVAVKTISDTIGECRTIPSRIVFGILHRFAITSTDLIKLKRMDSIYSAQADLNSIIAEENIFEVSTNIFCLL